VTVQVVGTKKAGRLRGNLPSDVKTGPSPVTTASRTHDAVSLIVMPGQTITRRAMHRRRW
jgi:hypothetical protein